MEYPPIFYIDLFCGAGGVTHGVIRAGAQVIACINHDPLAIHNHKLNNRRVLHFIEDIRTFDMSPMVAAVRQVRAEHPGAIIVLWASLECTHFSKAKGGDSRDADSRTLAEHLYRYIDALDPDYIDIENVVEFMSWGPLRIACGQSHETYSDLKVKLNSDGTFNSYVMHPSSTKKGRDYLAWHQHIESMGYDYDHRIFNAADFGARTSRVRYFGQFKKPELPFTWPQPTHAKDPSKFPLLRLKKWLAVKPCLDLEDKGRTIFRDKPLAENSYKRIYAGLIKHVAGGKDPEWIMKYLSNSAKSGVSNPVDLSDPAPTITTQNRLAIVQAQNEPNLDVLFVSKYFGDGSQHHSKPVSLPIDAITTVDHHSFVFLQKYYGTGITKTIKAPADTLTTKDRLSLVWIDKQFRSDKTIRPSPDLQERY